MKVFSMTLLFVTFDLIASNNFFLSSGHDHSCATKNDETICWGENGVESDVPPKLINTKQLESGGAHSTCALDSEGVKCWGLGYLPKITMPTLKSPKQISVGYVHACALDSEGVKCWGYNMFEQLNVPKLKNPTYISSNANHTCALDEDGVKCWGQEWYVEQLNNAPKLSNPKKIVIGFVSACALDDTGVKCWGLGSLPQKRVPTLKNPKDITIGDQHACVLDDDGVKCWGDNSLDQLIVPKLQITKLISAKDNHTCALDDTGIKCWGKVYFGTTIVPELSFFTLMPSLPAKEVFLRLIPYSYLYRLPLYNELVSLGDKIEVDRSATALVIDIATYDVIQNTAKFFTERVIPEYITYRESLFKETGITTITQIPKSQNVLTASIALTKGVLLSSKQILNAESSQKMISEFLARLGKIEAIPQISKMQDLLKDMTEFSKMLSENQKLFGMSQVLVALSTYYNN